MTWDCKRLIGVVHLKPMPGSPRWGGSMEEVCAAAVADAQAYEAGGADGIMIENFGDVPFYALPFIELRGVPAFRYVADNTVVGEVEIRWDFVERWSAVFFGGVGAAVGEGRLSGQTLPWNAGLGFRYLLVKDTQFRVGIDVARGPETFAGYIILGTAWPGL